MSRLILVPQYPAKLRYQEWWRTELPLRYAPFFDEVVVLGAPIEEAERSTGSHFSPMAPAIRYELSQVGQYLSMPLRKDDVLLLCDLSFPGIFGQVLFHKRPNRCFAICHATSKNRYDYFAHDRRAKWKSETAVARMMDGVFVATHYHRKKLHLWDNVHVVGLPMPPASKWLPPQYPYPLRRGTIVSVARSGVQKRTVKIERAVERRFGSIRYPIGLTSWPQYYEFLSKATVVLVTAKEETFGYQIVDAMENACVPVVPNAFSYPELLPRQYRYDNIDELLSIIQRVLDGGLRPPSCLLTDTQCYSFYTVTSQIMKGERDVDHGTT